MDASWWSRALGPEVVIPTLLALGLGMVTIWYARRGPVPRERQRDFATSMRGVEIFEQPVLRTDEFQFLFRGQPVSQVAEYRFIFANTGYEPIVKEDFDEPIQLKFDGDGAVFDCQAAICRPPNLKIDVSFDTERKLIVVAPLLLNPGDFASVDFILTNRPKIRSGGRIKGIKSFGALAGGTYDWNSMLIPCMFILFGLLVTTMPWWVFLMVRSEYEHLFRKLHWMNYSQVVLGLGVMYGGLKMFRSWAYLYRARYLGRGTEGIFISDDKKVSVKSY